MAERSIARRPELLPQEMGNDVHSLLQVDPDMLREAVQLANELRVDTLVIQEQMRNLGHIFDTAVEEHVMREMKAELGLKGMERLGASEDAIFRAEVRIAELLDTYDRAVDVTVGDGVEGMLERRRTRPIRSKPRSLADHAERAVDWIFGPVQR